MHTNPEKTAVITGASSGIGAAFARHLATAGYGLTLIARREDRLTALATELQQRGDPVVTPVIADLTNPADVAHLTQRLRMEPPPDLLVNNAGFGVPGAFADVALAQHLELLAVQVLAPVRFSRAVLPGMIARGHGAIINVASIGAFLPKPGDATYCAGKAYLLAFSQALRRELRGTGVRVQALCPGFTHTDFYARPAYAGTAIPARIPGCSGCPPTRS